VKLELASHFPHELIKLNMDHGVHLLGFNGSTFKSVDIYLTYDEVRELIPLLQHFVDTGELPIDNTPPFDPTAPPIWEVLEALGKSIPEVEWDKRKRKQSISNATKKVGSDDNAH